MSISKRRAVIEVFGNIPIVKNNFGIVTILIIVISVMPAVIAMLRRRRGPSGVRE